MRGFPCRSKLCVFKFDADKKRDPDNPQWSNLPCTMLKAVHWCVSITYLTLPGVRDISPYSGSDYYSCKIDLQLAYLYIPVLPRDAAWLAFRSRGSFYN